MANLRSLKSHLHSVKKTRQITRAMKMVAAVKLRHAQEDILGARPYAYKIDELIANVALRSSRGLHPLLEKRKLNCRALVIVTADRGLCGGFNMNIIRKAKEFLESTISAEPIRLILVGKKGRDYFKREGKYKIVGDYVNFWDDLEYKHSRVIIQKIIDLYTYNRLDRVDILYNEFKSALQQEVITEQVLPIEPPEITDKSKIIVDYLYEPSPDEVLETLLPKHLNIQMWRILLESLASEFGARMTAMDSATNNADSVIDNLKLLRNRLRQSIITREISEITGATEALRG